MWCGRGCGHSGSCRLGCCWPRTGGTDCGRARCLSFHCLNPRRRIRRCCPDSHCAPPWCFLGLVAGLAESLSVGVAGGPGFRVGFYVVDVPDRSVAPGCPAGLVPGADHSCQTGREGPGLGLHRCQFPGHRVQVEAPQGHRGSLFVRWRRSWGTCTCTGAVSCTWWRSLPAGRRRGRLLVVPKSEGGADQVPGPCSGDDPLPGEVCGRIPGRPFRHSNPGWRYGWCYRRTKPARRYWRYGLSRPSGRSIHAGHGFPVPVGE